MPHTPALLSARRFASTALLLLATGLSACGDDDTSAPAASTPAAADTTAAAREFEQTVDTAATAKAASATEASADELKIQADAIMRGLSDAGFDPNNVGKLGDAKADIVVDTSWAVYVYASERAAAEFVLSLKEIGLKDGNYELFRVENRVYYASMTTPLGADGEAKLDKMAAAAEGAIAAG